MVKLSGFRFMVKISGIMVKISGIKIYAQNIGN